MHYCDPQTQQTSCTTLERHMTYRNFQVKQTGSKFFYWSPRALRWLPVAKSKVSFS